MGFWSRKTTHYWVGGASRYLKKREPEKALAAVSHLYKYKGKKDRDSYTAYALAAFFSGLAYVSLRDLGNARIWLNNFEEMNPPNKQWLEDLRREVEKLEAESKEGCLTAIEMLEASGGEEGVLLAKGFRNIERGSNEEAIEVFNEVLKRCGKPDPQIGVTEISEYDQKVSMALLGLVLSYLGLVQIDRAEEYLVMLDRKNPAMAEEFRKTWTKSPPHL